MYNPPFELILLKDKSKIFKDVFPSNLSTIDLIPFSPILFSSKWI